MTTERQAASMLQQAPVSESLDWVRDKGVRLWAENGRLHYKARKGTLTPNEIQFLRAWKDPLIALIGAVTTEPPRQLAIAPLAFSQLLRWNLSRLRAAPGLRQVASATLLIGALNVDALQASVEEVVRRHDALRTQIVIRGGVPVQEIAEFARRELHIEDLTAVKVDAHGPEVTRLIQQFILQPVNVAVDPLFAACLLKLQPQQQVLVLAMEHIISDGVSLAILERELFAAYDEAARGVPISLPPIALQFSDYARRQRASHGHWIENHAEFWHERLEQAGRLRFPRDTNLATNSGWGAVPIYIDAALRSRLCEFCRLGQTSLAMGVFVAYVALVFRWCSASEAVIRYQSDGRDSPSSEHTIGYFAATLHLRLRLREDDSYKQLMVQVVQEYCEAYQHADFSCLEAQIPRPEFARNTAFNWVPMPSAVHDEASQDVPPAITRVPIRYPHPMMKNLELDHEPTVLLNDSNAGIVGDLYFPTRQFRLLTMQRFSRNFTNFLESLVAHPEARVRDIPLID